jgi:hypothetical protein
MHRFVIARVGALAASVIDALFARDAVLQIERNNVIGKKARHNC